jgi:hypothetical protein
MCTQNAMQFSLRFNDIMAAYTLYGTHYGFDINDITFNHSQRRDIDDIVTQRVAALTAAANFQQLAKYADDDRQTASDMLMNKLAFISSNQNLALLRQA